MTNKVGMLGRDESMPNVDPNADMPSGDRDIARALALDILERDVVLEKIPPRLLKLLMRAAVRYIPAGVPESAPHEVAAADDRTRPAFVPGHPDGLAPPPPYTGSPAVDFPTGLKPCTCDNCLGSSVRCRGAQNLGAGWYCQQTLARGGTPLAAGVICEPIEEESSGVCEASDDGTTRQNNLHLTGYFDVGDATRK